MFINVFGNAVATIVIVGERLRHRTNPKVLHSRTTMPPQAESDAAKVGADK
ncbi:hypothetical protein O1Q96_21290 [Streptomyces sp. Qhu-G9]|nr:hypothetical protein [Streptomyces aurantiacus]WAU82090.1 hypothetical protein O1Q96_21290 [Streptomyces aurantiacus]